MADASDRSAVLIVDMLNFFAREGDAAYQRRFDALVRNITILRERARSHDIPIIYVNTSFPGTSEFLASPMASKSPVHWLAGSEEAEVVASLAPEPTDLVVTKTVNSGFYGTTLEHHLQVSRTTRIFLAGVHTHVCIALTAADAFYRGYDTIVIEDCVTTIMLERHKCGLAYIERHLGRLCTLQTFPSVPTPSSSQP